MKTLADMLQMMVVDNPMDKLRSMWVNGADKASGAQEGKGQGAHLPEDVGRLKELAAQKEYIF